MLFSKRRRVPLALALMISASSDPLVAEQQDASKKDLCLGSLPAACRDAELDANECLSYFRNSHLRVVGVLRGLLRSRDVPECAPQDLERIRAERDAAREALETAREAAREREAERLSLDRRTRDFETEISGLQDRLADMHSALEEERGRRSDLAASLERARMELAEARAATPKGAQRIAMLNSQARQLRRQLDGVQELLDAEETKNEDLQAQISSLGKRFNSALARELELKRHAAEEAAEITRLKAELKAARATPEPDASDDQNASEGAEGAAVPTRSALQRAILARKDLFGVLSGIQHQRLITALRQGRAVEDAMADAWGSRLRQRQKQAQAVAYLCSRFSELCKG